MEIKISRLARLTMPLVVAAALSACNDDETQTPVVPPSVDEPQEVETSPIVSLPDSAPTPSAEQFSFSYVVQPAADASAAVSRTDDYAAWTLSCGDSALMPAGFDDFGPYWLVDVASLASCSDFTVLDDEQNQQAAFSVTAEDVAGKAVGLGEGLTELVTGSRTAVLLTSQGLSQIGTDVILPTPEAPGELAAPGAGQIALQLYYPFGDGSGYDTMSLHLWNDGDCQALTDGALNSGWEDKSVVPAESDQYGPVWHLDIDEDGQCFNVIFRDENNGKLIDADLNINLAELGENNSLTFIVGKSDRYDTRDAAFEVGGPSSDFIVDSISAIMVDQDTLVWAGGDNANMVQLMFTHDGQYDVNEGIVSGTSIILDETTLSEELQAKFPHLKDKPVFSLPELPENISIKDILKGSVVAIASDTERELRSVTSVQYAGALDALYADSAKQLAYGPVYGEEAVSFRLWAPTARDVQLALYSESKGLIEKLPMVEDKASGSWSVEVPKEEADGVYYRYAMTIFNPRDQKTYAYEVTDPYSVSLSMNSIFSQAVDLSSDELKPEGWDGVEAPHSQAEADLSKVVLLESHVRDFSSRDASTTNKGKYLAFTESQSVPVTHLKALQEAGMTHLHLMPVFDIATINEDPDQVVNVDDDFSKLCSLNAPAADSALNAHCGGGITIAEVFAQLAEAETAANAGGSEEGEVEAANAEIVTQVNELNELLRGVDSYNWGYDPYHYTVPEGSYATDAEGTTRILEFREMVKAVKEDIGMNVVVDVVYNHTNASGLNDKSVLDKVVPLYYHRLTEMGIVETSTCCDNTAPEHAMFAKLIADSVKVWTEQYKIDAYRWDLMGHHPLAQMQETLAAAREINEEVYFYGEGWNFGEVENDARFVQATQANLGGTGIGSFSDRLRDAVRGGSPFDSKDGIRKTQGFGTGAYVLPNELVDIELDEQTNGEYLKDDDGNDIKDDDGNLMPNPDGLSDELMRALHQADLTRLGMAGNLKDFEMLTKDGEVVLGRQLDYNGQAAGYAEQPWEIQNYVSKHDNQTLWDINMYKVASEATAAERARMQAVAVSTVLLGQAMPFNHMGVDLLRSKSMQRDSYDYGDWFNLVDFTGQTNNWNVGLPAADKDADNYPWINDAIQDENSTPSADDIAKMKAFYLEMLRLRKSTGLITLPNAEEIISRVDFRNTGPDQEPGLIVMTIDNGSTQATDLDPSVDSVVVIINASPEVQTVNGFTTEAQSFALSTAHDQDGIAEGASFANGTFSVPAWSSAVFVEARGDERGEGLAPTEKAEVPPFGQTGVYVRGDMNGWGATDLMSFIGNATYQVVLDLDVADYNFKVANGNADWAGDPNIPCNWAVQAEDSMDLGTQENCALSIEAEGAYVFSLDASYFATEDDSDVPVLSVTPHPFGTTAIFVRGSVTDANWAAIPAAQFSYVGGGIYEADIALTAGDFAMKIADEGWTDGTNFGGSGEFALDSAYALDSGDNIAITVPADGTYTFTLDATNPAVPTLMVSAAE